MMNLRKLFYTSLCILAAVSCKKDSTTESLPSLEGQLEILNLTEFVKPGATLELSSKGAIHPENGPLVTTWKLSPLMNQYDTVDVFTYKLPYELETYTITCYVSAEGYYGLTATGYTTVIASGEDGSIQGVNYKEVGDNCVSIRNMKYYYKQIGEQTWTLNNMAVREGMAFRNADIMSDVFGRYYNYEEAIAACDSLNKSISGEKRWQLPSKEDWDKLEAYVNGLVNDDKDNNGKSIVAALAGDFTFNGVTMWEYWPKVGYVTNSSGFSAMPVGYSNTEAGTSDGVYEYAAFWTATEVNETDAYYKYIISDQPMILNGIGNKKSHGASVRCILK